MRINYNVTGGRRKELVRIIADATGAKPKYMKMPTYSYAIGNLIVTKNGALEWDECTTQETIDKVTAALRGASFIGEPDEASESDADKPVTLGNSKETAEPESIEEAGLTVEIPLDKVSVGNLSNILDSKGSLIKKALDIEDIRFEVKEDRVAFPWFPEMPEPDEVKAYTHFIADLCKLSKELKRANPRETETTNEKYAFRCFLLRLGFIGAEYKQERKILLRNLSGNSSWKNGAPEKEIAGNENN